MKDMYLLVVFVVQPVAFRFILEVWTKATLGVFSSLVAGHTARCSLPTFPLLQAFDEGFHKTPLLSSHVSVSSIHSYLRSLKVELTWSSLQLVDIGHLHFSPNF